MHKGYSVQHLIKHNKTNENYFWWRALTFIGLIVDSRRSQMHTDRGVRAPIIDFSSGYFFFVIFFWCCWKLWQVRNSSVTTRTETDQSIKMNGELNLQGLVVEYWKDLTSSSMNAKGLEISSRRMSCDESTSAKSWSLYENFLCIRMKEIVFSSCSTQIVSDVVFSHNVK